MTPVREDQYPFADIELARRLERTEAQGSANFIEARTRAFPEAGAQWIEVAGAYAMLDGPGSPLSQTFGLGVFQPITSEELDQIEQFFQANGAEIFHEVCPMADQSVFALIRERGYQPVEFSNVLYRPISTDLRLHATRNERIKVRVVEKDGVELWAQTSFEGWSEFPEYADFFRDLAKVWAHSKGPSFLAEVDGKPIATGALTIHDDVALLAGASTIPAARRQGAQLALLEDRLRYAAQHGCTVAMMVALPGSGSQRNAERHGFRIAYTRTKWHLNKNQEGNDAGL
ncbi:MAG TPA: GNAT family N-acetyltransferase [Pyrinomonadaceae bacterium]|nr:GNAT family N-acetyltransferase [Pyrinomonadaceae bacterium]